MADLDLGKLAEALGRVLASPDDGVLPLDDEGWATLDATCDAVSATLRVTVGAAHVARAARQGGRFELQATRIRLARRPRLPAVPDILFHATTAAGEAVVRQSGVLQADEGRRLWLSEDEAHAWRVAHRQSDTPRVLVVDAGRARRAGVRIQRARQTGLFTAAPVPARHVINLRDTYAEQWSAGGLPVVRFPDGTLRVALVEVTRRSGVTWEIAKGKLEPGEAAEDAATREVQEEMGLACGLRILRHVGDVRYAFLAPGALPRLKTIFLYLMEPFDPACTFEPRTAEGIGAVRWFLPEDAARAVTHTSLQPLMWRAADLLARYELATAAEALP